MIKQSKPSFISLLKNYAFPLWKELILLAILSLIASAFISIQPLFISALLEIIMGDNTMLNNLSHNVNFQFDSFFDLNTVGEKVKNLLVYHNANVAKYDTFQKVLAILALFLIVAFFSSVFNYAAEISSKWLRVSSTQLIRMDVAKHLLSLNLSFFQNQKNGELISRFTQDATNTATGLGPLLHGFIHHGILIVVYSTYLFSTDYLMAVVALLIICLHWALTKMIKSPVRISERKHFDKIANVVNTMQETLTSIRVIKSFGADKFELEKIKMDIDASKNAEFNAGVIQAIDPHTRLFLDNIAIAAIFLIGVMQLENEELTLQGFLLFVFVGKLLITPINKFAVNFIWMQSLLASYDRLFEIFQAKNEVLEGSRHLDSFNEGIIVKHVNFSYGKKEVLHDISFDLYKGETLAIVGPSGSGKSTLTDLLLRMYDPNSGSVSIDGVDLRQLNSSIYRKIFGVVSQESLLFNDSIFNNICFGRELFDKGKVESAAKIANAHDFIMELSNGYQTMVGDRGIKLSGGQRQRISIARAIYSSPEIVIFDEATSSLDSESEEQVHKAIDNVLSHSTAVIIAHRLSTILHADKILVLNNGKLEAIGKHKDLLETNETYRTLYHLQFSQDES